LRAGGGDAGAEELARTEAMRAYDALCMALGEGHLLVQGARRMLRVARQQSR
jgi:hypothetical protein